MFCVGIFLKLEDFGNGLSDIEVKWYLNILCYVSSIHHKWDELLILESVGFLFLCYMYCIEAGNSTDGGIDASWGFPLASYHISLKLHLSVLASSKRSLPAIVLIINILVSKMTKRLGGNIEQLAGGKHNSLEEIQTCSIYGTSFCDPSIFHKVHI